LVLLGLGVSAGLVGFAGKGVEENGSVKKSEAAAGPQPLQQPQATSQKTEEDFITAAFDRGVAALGRNALDAAVSEFRAVLEKDPKHLGAVMHLGSVAHRRKDWEGMEVRMREALRLGASGVDNALVWMGLGFATLEQGKWEAATAAFAQTISLDPNNARARRFLALTLGRRGWFQAAEEEMRRSLQLDPDDAGAHFNLAVFYLQRQPVALELARRHYYRALELGFTADPEVETQLKAADPGEEKQPSKAAQAKAERVPAPSTPAKR
jgi:Flp pilus assembly protein TadD